MVNSPSGLKVLIVRGLPGSGKTTYALDLMKKYPGKYKRVNKDDLREMLTGQRWADKGEWFIVKIRDLIVDLALNNGFNVIVDDTNLNPIHIKRIKEIVANRAKVEIVDFTNVPLEECFKRDKQRVDSVGEKVIREMYQKYLKQVG